MSDDTTPHDPAHDHDPEPETHGLESDRGPTQGAPGKVIGPYTLIRLLGEGGMGEAWLAEQARPVRRQVALKVLQAGLDTKPMIARFEAERQALAIMDHSSIAKVFDAGTTPEGHPYFVMEYVDGEPITHFCDRHGLSTRERLALFVQLCEGVQHAHQKAILHRDLKPSNVLVTMQDGRHVPKVIDFGIAKALAKPLTDKTLQTELGAFMGTPDYMSPEQAGLTGQDVDTRADVYSLGVMLYELLVGARPFDPQKLRSGGLAGIARTIQEEEPPRPSERLDTLGERAAQLAKDRRSDPRSLRGQLRGDLDWIVMKAIEKDRARRYGSPVELAQDIERHLADEPVSAGPPSAGYRARKFVRRHRVGVTAASIATVALVAFGVTMAVQARRIAAERAASDKVAEFLGDIWSKVPPNQLGIALWKELHERAAEVQRRRGASPEKVSAAVWAIDEALDGVNPTDAALHLLDSQVLGRAGESLAKRRDLDPRIAARLELVLANTYWNLGLLAPAERHARRAIELDERTLGAESPQTLAARSTLALVYFKGTRLAEAEALHREILAVQRRVLGPEHPDTIQSMSGLAGALLQQGKNAEAETLFAKVLDVRRRTLGPDHEDTLRALDHLAVTLTQQGRHEEAIARLSESLLAHERVFGKDHPNTLAAKYALAYACAGAGQYAEAEKLLIETLAAQRLALGEDHPNAIDTLNELAFVHIAQNRLADAQAEYRVLLERQRRTFGPNSYQAGITAANLGSIAAHLGDRAQALSWLKDAVEHGFAYPDHLLGDEDLKSLRGDPGFEAVVERARKNARPK